MQFPVPAGFTPRQLYGYGTRAAVATRGTELLCGLAHLWLLTRLLGPVDFGRFSLALAIVGICTVLAATGLERLVIFRLSRDAAAPGELSGAELAGSVLGWGLLLACSMSAVLFLSAPALGTVFDDGCAWWLRRLCLLIPVQVALRLMAAWHAARQRLSESQVAGRLVPEVCSVALLAAVWLGGGGAGAVIAALVLSRLAVAATWWASHAIRPWPLPARMRRADALYAAGVSGNGLLFQGLAYSDLIMVGILAGPAQVALYAVASKLAMVLLASRELVTPLLEPRMGYLLGRGSRSDLRREYDQVRAISMIVALALLVPLVGGSRPLLAWFGADAPATGVLLILAASALTHAAFGHSGMLLMMAGRVGWSLAASALLLAGNIALNALWIPRFGALGAASATLVSSSAVQILRVVIIDRLEDVTTMNWPIAGILCAVVSALVWGAMRDPAPVAPAAIAAGALALLCIMHRRSLVTAIHVFRSPSGRRDPGPATRRVATASRQSS
jgi:O-antigen/teichoic acid export membrane protein